MDLLCDILKVLIGLEPDESTNQNLHPPLLGLGTLPGRSNLQRADAFGFAMKGLKSRIAGRNLVGKQFGRLLVVKYNGCRYYSKRWRGFWKCKCECGNMKSILGESLVSGAVRSCNCLHIETARMVNYRHGGYHHPLYYTWTNMLRRCRDAKIPNYKHYGGRGIKVCRRWHNFRSFVKDIAPGWKPGLTLDRIDNNGNYTPLNCKWSTAREQCCNFRRNKMVTFRGETLCLSAWCRKLRINYGRVCSRIRNLHWSPEDALTLPVSTRYKRL
jgi:hypothetical protein